jgi:hypothetical protein
MIDTDELDNTGKGIANEEVPGWDDSTAPSSPAPVSDDHLTESSAAGSPGKIST